MQIRPLGHHELMLLLLQLAALLFTARACGELCRRIRVPAVVGELGAGVLLGPSLLGLVAPAFQSALFPANQLQNDLLSVVTWLGVIFLLLATGLETDIALIRRQGRKAPLISVGGISITFTLGYLLGRSLPDSMLADPGQRLVFALFVATAMSISAIPVIARVLMEMQVIRRDIGQLILAAGMIDDTFGWILLSVVAGLAGGGALDPWIPVRSVLAVLGVLLFAFTIGRRLVATLYRWVDDNIQDGITSLVVVMVFLAGAATLKLGLEAVLGAFAFGILLRQAPRYRPDALHSLEHVTGAFLSPIFFGAAGLKVNLTVFTDVTLLGWGLLVLAVACLGKFVGVLGGSKLAGLSTWEGVALGSGLNARGAMEIIVATIGLSLGVLSIDMYSIIVMVAIATSLMAPPMLRWTLKKVQISAEEAARLEQEAWEKRSFWGGLRRVLLPTRGGGNARFAASLLAQALAGKSVEVTVVNLRRNRRRWWFFRRKSADAVDIEAALQAAVDTLAPLTARSRGVEMDNHPAPQVIARLAKDHDLIVLGASEEQLRWGSIYAFGPVIDDILNAVSQPVLVVRTTRDERRPLEAGLPARPLRKILLPTSGTSSGQAALELGHLLTRNSRAEATVLYVEESGRGDAGGMYDIHLPDEVVPGGAGSPPPGGATRRRAVRAPRPGPAIVKVAEEEGADLIVLSAQLRSGGRRAYLGPHVEHVLRTAPCSVAVLILQ